MAVKARFFVASTQRFSYNRDAITVRLQAVSRGEENKEWASATPSGTVEMSITKGPAADWFANRLGEEVVLTFEDGGEPTSP